MQYAAPIQFGVPIEPIEALGTARPLFYEGEDLRDVLQAVVDAAWDEGIRPKQATDRATRGDIERHLEDMRTIVLHKFGVTQTKSNG